MTSVSALKSEAEASGTRINEVDVVVVGAGAAGMMAAIEAHDAGAEVMVLQKLPEPGGKSMMAIGSITAAGTSMQRAVGIEDSPEAFIADLGRRTDLGKLPPQALHKLKTVIARSGPAVERLIELGVTFSGPHPEFAGEAYRMHSITPDVRTLVQTLSSRARRRGIRIRGDWPIDRLLTDDAGAVIGVEGKHGITMARRGVILATGDFSAPPRLPGAAAPRGSEWAIRAWASGDGQLMAKAIGASLSELDEPLTPMWRMFDWPYVRIDMDMLEAGAVIVDKTGGRVADESQKNIGRQLAARNYVGDTFLVFDKRVIDRIATAADDSAHARDGWLTKGKLNIGSFPGVAYGYIEDFVKAGYAHVEDSPEKLAAWFGIDPQGLAAGLADRGVNQPPYFCAGPVHLVVIGGAAGIDVDDETRVLRADGSVIAGLYAAGTVSGRASSGHGYGLGYAVVSGRIAGVAAAGRNSGGSVAEPISLASEG